MLEVGYQDWLYEISATCLRVKGDHMICHMTILGASEDYTSQHDLELSEVQHVTLKIFREER